MSDTGLLVEIIDRAYNRRSWHGTNLRGSIRGLTARQALRRPARGRHNIRELVVHAAYWKYVVRRRLTGEPRGSFPLDGSNWFVRSVASEAAWKEDIALLDKTHRALRSAIETFPEKDWKRRPAGSSVTNLELVAGIAAHDLYHAGQIQLIKRLLC
jgi:uncharacterized damage-inducible protein DinB